MLGSKILSTILLAAVSVSALAVEKVAPRQNACVITCGSICYWQESVDEAVQKGFELYQAGDTVGSNDYPHQFNNREGFDFPGASPYYEFPILSSFVPYTGGSPGPDRVVFNRAGTFQGGITHTGASGNNFVECT